MPERAKPPQLPRKRPAPQRKPPQLPRKTPAPQRETPEPQYRTQIPDPDPRRKRPHPPGYEREQKCLVSGLVNNITEIGLTVPSSQLTCAIGLPMLYTTMEMKTRRCHGIRCLFYRNISGNMFLVDIHNYV